MKNAFFKLAFPPFSRRLGQALGELTFWVLFATLHALLGTGLMVLLPDHTQAPKRASTAALRPAARPLRGPVPVPGKHLPRTREARPAVPVGVHPVGNSLQAQQSLPALAGFPLAYGCR